MPDDDEKTIYEFCQDGNEQRVEQMLKRNFDVNKPDETVKQQILNILNFKHTIMSCQSEVKSNRFILP